MMRAIRTCVAGLLGLAVVVSAATAEELDWNYQVEQVRFVAPEPTPADEAYDSSLGAIDSSLGAIPEPDATSDLGYAYAEDMDCPECVDAYACGRPCRRCGRRMIGSTCNMGQHQAYFPPMHGYYYFRPYHHSQVWNQQSVARMWGEDPANPYSNRLFQMVYEQYRAEDLTEQPAFLEEGVEEVEE